METIKSLNKYIRNLQMYFKKDIDTTLTKLSGDLVKETKMRFHSTKTSPDNVKWYPLSPKYAKWKVQVHGSEDILVLSGRLRDSINKLIENRRDEHSIELGTDIEYAGQHQYGKGRIPQRPFLGFTERNLDTAMKEIFSSMEKL